MFKLLILSLSLSTMSVFAHNHEIKQECTCTKECKESCQKGNKEKCECKSCDCKKDDEKTCH
jgi:hypothetical protein